MKPMIFTTPEPIGGNGYSCRSPPFTLPPPYIKPTVLSEGENLGAKFCTLGRNGNPCYNEGKKTRRCLT